MESRWIEQIEAVSPLKLSVSIHFLGLTLAAGAFFMGRWSPEVVDFEVYENPVVSQAAKPAVKPFRPKVKQEVKPQKKAVFGLKKKSVVTENPDAVLVKAGNTVAKAPDKKILKEDDPESLPLPVEEYLVTQMPQLLSEVRVPYPPEAKKKGIRGAVTMNLLIDREGVVREAKLHQGVHPLLDQAALQAVQDFKFRPARVEEKPVPVRIRYRYRFVLE